MGDKDKGYLVLKSTKEGLEYLLLPGTDQPRIYTEEHITNLQGKDLHAQEAKLLPAEACGESEEELEEQELLPVYEGWVLLDEKQGVFGGSILFNQPVLLHTRPEEAEGLTPVYSYVCVNLNAPIQDLSRKENTRTARN